MNFAQAPSVAPIKTPASRHDHADHPTPSSHGHSVGDAGAPRTTEHPAWKRTLDLLCVTAAIPVLLPVMGLIAVTIKLVSPGPVFFKQVRIGRGRSRFMCYKFRSMKVGADESAHKRDILHRIHSNAPMAKMDGLGDPRLIPLGAILRASGMDELPQLLNVWRGEMSLVGPRPCTTYELDSYLPRHHGRFDTLPGLTGLWQVSGKNRTTFNEMVDLDVRYARSKSLRLDLSIMARTFATVAGQILHAHGGNRARLEARHGLASQGSAISRAHQSSPQVGQGPIAV